MTGAFLFLKDIAFIKFTRCGLIAKICHRGNSRQKEMCYDSSIRNKTAAKNNGGRHMLKTTELFIKEMNVHAEADALVDETTAAKVTMELMMRMASIVDEAYPMINKAIWA